MYKILAIIFRILLALILFVATIGTLLILLPLILFGIILSFICNVLFHDKGKEVSPG